jgi:NAD-dependent dihydropyrimidine dehydrogenase PreA subunit
MALRPKVVKLCKVVGGLTGTVNKIDENAPEYYSLASILTDEECDVAIAAGLRKERTAEYLAAKVGKPVDEVRKIAERLAWIGVFRITNDPKTGKDIFFMQIFAPGIMEMLVNNQQLLAEHPEIGRAFEEYTRVRMANMAPMMPNGYGLMRVVPIESAIKDIPDVRDYDKLSYYLGKYDIFSVSPCSCRASRRTLNDGCGHLEQDMCIQMGKGAEHYIRTGRGRQVSREEVLEILKRAEDNGLMHDMPNIEEAGESSAICNCCACSCFGLRVGLLYGARDVIRSNFVAKVDEEKCVACGQCVENCPGNALKLGQKLCTRTPLAPPPDYRKMRDSMTWGKGDWNVDYREDREDVMATGTAPCKTACPAHIAVQGYLKLAAQGKYQEALALIKKENPFPAVCGRICNHRCETECTRGSVDEAVAIDEVKRFIADHDLHAETRYVPPMVNQIGKPYPQKIAIVGAGPAGLTCAYYLAEKGYHPTVFDRSARPGGMLMNGIPSFRLEKDVVQAEIDILKDMGVEFRCGVEVGKDITIQQLRDEGYKGFYLAIGCQGGRKVGIPGEDAEGVQAGVVFMREVCLGRASRLSAHRGCGRRQRGRRRGAHRDPRRLGRDLHVLPRVQGHHARRGRRGRRGRKRGHHGPQLLGPEGDPHRKRQGHGRRVQKVHPRLRRRASFQPPVRRGRHRHGPVRKRAALDRPVDRVGRAAQGHQGRDRPKRRREGRPADLPDRRARHLRGRRRLHRPEVRHRRDRRRQGGPPSRCTASSSPARPSRWAATAGTTWRSTRRTSCSRSRASTTRRGRCRATTRPRPSPSATRT